MNKETQITISKIYDRSEKAKCPVYEFEVPETYSGRLADIDLEIARAILGEGVIAMYEVNDEPTRMSPKRALAILQEWSEKSLSQYPG